MGLRFTQLCIDFESNGAGDPQIFQHFFLLDKSVTSFKLFIAAYREVHTEGVGMFAISYLIGLFLHLFAIVIHLYINHRGRARSWISSMAILLAAGAFLLAVKIPEDYAWHNTTVEAILICFACLEAFLLVRNKMSENGGNANLLRDLVMILSETVITVYLFVDYLRKTHSPWDAHKILHLVGSCLAVLIGLCRFGWVAYKAYTHQVLAGGEEQAAGAAMDGGDVEQQIVEVLAEIVAGHGDGGGDVEQQMVEEAADIEVVEGGRRIIWLSAFTLFSQVVEWGQEHTSRLRALFFFPRGPPRVFTSDIEMVDRACIEGDGGDDDGEEMAAEQGASPA